MDQYQPQASKESQMNFLLQQKAMYNYPVELLLILLIVNPAFTSSNTCV